MISSARVPSRSNLRSQPGGPCAPALLLLRHPHAASAGVCPLRRPLLSVRLHRPGVPVDPTAAADSARAGRRP
eukprot:8791292-Pyramimonas_sp.AAC.1